MSRAIDLIITYRVVKMLITPFNKFEAFKLGIIDDYYSSIDNFKNFKVSEKLDLFRENSGTVYDLEKELNIEYQKHFTLNQRIGIHGPLWNVMGTRTIKVERTTK